MNGFPEQRRGRVQIALGAGTPIFVGVIGAAWGRRIPIIALTLGVTVAELQSRPGDSWREALESGLRSRFGGSGKSELLFKIGVATGMRGVPIVPRDINPGALPLDLHLRRYRVRDTREHTAEKLSAALPPA